MTFTREILLLLKRKYEEATGKVMKYDSNMESSQAEFYFELLEDNLFEPMNEMVSIEYRDGSGNELDEKMRALRSSSAMTYNLLGNSDVVIYSGTQLEAGRYKVSFEKQLPTIKNNPHKANLDAFLEGNNELIFCEMKMTEWLFNRPSSIRESYLDKKLYYDPDSYEYFAECIEKIKTFEPSDYRTFETIFTQYDAFQMYKHALAIYNYAYENKEELPQKIRLVNCVWELDDIAGLSDKAKETYLKKLECEHMEFQQFYAATESIRDRFNWLGIDFDILYLSAEQFAKCIDMSEYHRKYLKRYF